MDGTGKLPSNRMLDAFKDEDTMKKLYDVILKEAIAKKPWIKQFWDSADNTKSGFTSNGVVIGQTWDGPAISLKKAGQPISFMAPKEGAIGWIDGCRIDQGGQERAAGLRVPEVHPLHGRLGGGGRRLRLQPRQQGRDAAAVGEGAGRSSTRPIPGTALERMWWRPVEPSWFADLRTQYAEKFKAA